MNPSHRTLHWGILSTARINRALIGPLNSSSRNRLVAVASRDSGRARAYALERKIPQYYGNYEALLEDADIDVIYNPLPNSLHAEWTIKAAQAGKHVLCEKPLALSVEEVEAMAAAGRAAGVVIAEAFMYRHHPQTLKVKEMVDAGLVGDVRLVRGSFTFNIADPKDVRLDPALGGGSIWDVGCYPISYARLILGKEPIRAFGWQWTGSTGVDEAFSGQLLFHGDIFAQFDCGFRSPYRAHMEIVGTGGSILVPDPFKPGEGGKVQLTQVEGSRWVDMPPEALYLGEVEDMADAILTGKAPRVTLEDSRGNVAAIQALLKSAREGAPEAL